MIRIELKKQFFKDMLQMNNRNTDANNFPDYTDCINGVISLIFYWKHVESSEVWDIHYSCRDYISH